ncbi:Uncharacterised protein [Candidatus Tiddalikarchaeum anstoanum]|nr:Uncharacterised protein [Candidatus Tiddalikarchaeum anstoanum]
MKNEGKKIMVNFNSIRTKMIISLLIVLAIVITSYYLITNLYISDILRKDVESKNAQTLDYIHVILHSNIDSAQETLERFANDKYLISAALTGNPEDINMTSYMFTMVAQTKKFMPSLSYQNFSCVTKIAAQSTLSSVGRSYSSRDYCIGVTSTKAPYLSSMYIGATLGIPFLGLTVPVTVNNTMIGYVLGSLDMDFMRNYFVEAQSTRSYIILLDRYNNIFLDTRNVTTAVVNANESINAGVRLVSQELKVSDNGFFETGGYFIEYSKFDEDITAILFQPTEDAFYVINNVQIIQLYILTIFILLLSTIISLIISSITGRINKITNIVEDLSKGELDIEIDPKLKASKDEVGRLANAFERTIVSLKLAMKKTGNKILEEKKEGE